MPKITTLAAFLMENSVDFRVPAHAESSRLQPWLLVDDKVFAEFCRILVASCLNITEKMIQDGQATDASGNKTCIAGSNGGKL